MNYKDLTQDQKRIVDAIENAYAGFVSNKDFVTSLAFLINKYKMFKKKYDY